MFEYGNIFFDLNTLEYYVLVKVPRDDLEAAFALVCINDGIFWSDPTDGFPSESNLYKHMDSGISRFKFAAHSLSELYTMLKIDESIPVP